MDPTFATPECRRAYTRPSTFLELIVDRTRAPSDVQISFDKENDAMLKRNVSTLLGTQAAGDPIFAAQWGPDRSVAGATLGQAVLETGGRVTVAVTS